MSAKQRQLDVSQQNSVAAPTAYCFVTWMLFALVVSVNPVVCLVNDPCWLGERSRADIKRR